MVSRVRRYIRFGFPRLKIDDAAYKAALERIPDPKEKYDPWGVARPAEPAKKPK